MRWNMPVISVLGRLRLENHEFQASLDYIKQNPASKLTSQISNTSPLATQASRRLTWCLWEVLATAFSSSWHSVRWPERPSPGTHSQCHVHPALSWGPGWEPGIWSNHTVPWEQRREKNEPPSKLQEPLMLILKGSRWSKQHPARKEISMFPISRWFALKQGTKQWRKSMFSLDHFIHSFSECLLSTCQGAGEEHKFTKSHHGA